MLKPDIQHFAEPAAGTEPNANNGGTNAQGGGNNPTTFTQEDVDRIVNERTDRAAKAALKVMPAWTESHAVPSRYSIQVAASITRTAIILLLRYFLNTSPMTAAMGRKPMI